MSFPPPTIEERLSYLDTKKGADWAWAAADVYRDILGDIALGVDDPQDYAKRALREDKHNG